MASYSSLTTATRPGRTATLRAGDLVAGLDVRVVELLTGLDPADVLVATGARGLRRALADTVPLVDGALTTRLRRWSAHGGMVGCRHCAVVGAGGGWALRAWGGRHPDRLTGRLARSPPVTSTESSAWYPAEQGRDWSCRSTRPAES